MPAEHIPIDLPITERDYGINYGARRVRVFMDKTDWDHELGCAAGGNCLYPSIEDLRRCRDKCIDQCGIVEVEVTLVRIAQEDKLSERTAGDTNAG